ncbi:MAG: hypothetical protein AAGF45_08805 [Pseudomonadota bacterium]
MDIGVIIAIEMVLVFGGVLTFAIWELWSLRRDKALAAEASRQSRHPKR